MTDCLVLLQKQDARYLLKPLCHELSSQPPKAPIIMLQDMHLSAIDKREKRFIIANKVNRMTIVISSSRHILSRTRLILSTKFFYFTFQFDSFFRSNKFLNLTYLHLQNPKTPDLYELRCANKDQKETWNTSITVAKEQFSTGKLKHLSDQVFPQQHHPKLPSTGSVSKTWVT